MPSRDFTLPPEVRDRSVWHDAGMAQPRIVNNNLQAHDTIRVKPG